MDITYEYLRTVLIRIPKWSKDVTQATLPISRRKNGAHGNYPYKYRSIKKVISLGNISKVFFTF